MNAKLAAATAAATLLAACSGDSSPTRSAGTATGNIRVSAGIQVYHANPNIMTHYFVGVLVDGLSPAGGAEITVADSLGPHTSVGSSTYAEDVYGEPAGSTTLDVVAGSASLHGAWMNAPGPFTITAPLNGAEVPADQGLHLAFGGPAADSAIVQCNGQYVDATPDGATVPAAAMQPGTMYCNVWRTNRMDLPNLGSFEIQFREDLQVTVVPP